MLNVRIADADAYAYADAYANADADADADAYAYAYADAYADADANAYADAYANADANADANAYADAYADANAYAAYASNLKEQNMRNGIYAVTLWQGDRTVLRVGWFQRGAADDWRVWWTTPFRGEYQTRPSDVWAEGPGRAPNWTWGPVLESDASRFHFVPLARLDAAKWEKVCPRPAEYEVTP